MQVGRDSLLRIQECEKSYNSFSLKFLYYFIILFFNEPLALNCTVRDDFVDEVF